MGTRMKKYHNNKLEVGRTHKNHYIYKNLYDEEPAPVAVELCDNVRAIDVSKVKEMVAARETYKDLQYYQQLVAPIDKDEISNYDLYEDIEHRDYDINNILEQAKKERGPEKEQEARKKLRNTQYNILSGLDLKVKPELDREAMVKDFFTGDFNKDKLLETEPEVEIDKSADLFANLKSKGDTVLTEPIRKETNKGEIANHDQAGTFFTNAHTFGQEDFVEWQNLQGALKKNNRLMQALLYILIISILGGLIVLFIKVFDFI